MVLLSSVSVTCSQLQSKNIKWKIPEINNFPKRIYNKISLHICKNGYYQLINKQEVLERMWRKWNPSVLLVGVQTGVATVESRMEIPQKIKNETAL